MSYTTTWLFEPMEMVQLLRLNSAGLTVPRLEYIPRAILQTMAEEHFVAILPVLTTTINSYTSVKSSTPLGTMYKRLADKYIKPIRAQSIANQQAGIVTSLPNEVLEVHRTYPVTFIESLLMLSGKRPPLDVDEVDPTVVQSFAQSFLMIEMSRLGTTAPYGDMLKRTASWWYDVMADSVVEPPIEGAVLVDQFNQWLTDEVGVVLAPA